MPILAATDFSLRSYRAVRRAGLLARARGAELALVNVVDDDKPARLVDLERREAERVLEEQIQAVAELSDVRCRRMVVTGDPFDAISSTAREIGAELIVMGAHRRQLLRDIFVGTTIERVIRTGPGPVLMVNDEVTRPYARILAPVDMSGPSADAVRVARTLGLFDEAQLTLLHAFFPFAKGQMEMASLKRESIDAYVVAERQKAMDELSAFAAAGGLGGPGLSLRVEQGSAFEEIARAVKSTRPDLVVIGTHGRSGLMKVLLGSVTDDVLRHLEVDILVVPPAGRNARPEPGRA